MNFLRHTLAIFSILLILSGLFFWERGPFPGAATVEGWVHYASWEGNFRVDLPEEPTYTLKKVEIASVKRTLEYHEFMSEPEAAISYCVAYMPLPKSWRLARSKTILDTALKQLQRLDEGTELLKRSWASHGGRHLALDFHFKSPGKEERGRLIYVGGKLFKVTIIAPETLVSSEQGQLFIESFAHGLP